MWIAAITLFIAQASPPPDAEHVTRIVVEKNARKMTLLMGSTPVREYRVALGGQPVGPKVREGDHKTPEGLYAVDYKQPASNFHRALISPIPAPPIVRGHASLAWIRAEK